MDDHRAEAALHYGSIDWLPEPDVSLRLVGFTYPRGKALWEYQEPYAFVWGIKRHVIPQGYITDLNSVPTLARLIIPQCGSKFDCAAGIHDYLRRLGIDYTEADRAYLHFARKRGAAAWRVRLAGLGIASHSVLHALRAFWRAWRNS